MCLIVPILKIDHRREWKIEKMRLFFIIREEKLVFLYFHKYLKKSKDSGFSDLRFYKKFKTRVDNLFFANHSSRIIY